MDKYDELGHELEEEEEEYDDGYEDRIAEIEKNMEQMRGTINEKNTSLGHNAFSRRLGPPEPFKEDRIVSADEIEKIVIDETESEGENSEDKESNVFDEELSFERINPEGQFEKLSEEQFKEALKEDSLIEGSIEDAKFGNELEVTEVYETYDQPELVREWEEMYHSEKEEVLSDEALAQLQQSMDSMAGLEDSVFENLGAGESITTEAPDDLSQATDAFTGLSDYISSEEIGEFDSEQDDDSDLDMDLDVDFGSHI